MKKIICFIMAFVSILTVSSVYAASSLKDVDGTKYEEAVEMLGKFKVVNGYSDNTFKPKGEVTRAELAKMLVIVLGKEDEVTAAKKKYLDFSDVLSGHWGYGYIKIASDAKLVNGYADGTFKPDGKVTYGEATTMIVRALGYEDAVKKSKLSWPDNYMTYADEELELFKNMSTFKASSNAIRGDVALILWNALRTGTAEIVAENSSGLVYGPGTPMISQYLGYNYLRDAEIVYVEFDDDYKTAEVEFKEEGKKKTKSFEFDAEDVFEMYGKKVTILFSAKDNSILSLDSDTDLKTVRGEVSNITETKIYITSKSSGYKIPDDDCILLYGIEELDDACEVILLVDGNTAEYCIAMGADDVTAGIVIDDRKKIDDEYGIKVREVGQSKGGEEYLLADEDNWPSGDSIILYYVNDDDLLVVLRYVTAEDAEVIADMDDDYIKISKKVYYEFDDEKDYDVYLVNGSKIKEGDLDDIDIKADTLATIEYNAHLYFFVFVDGITDSLDPDVVDAYDELSYWIEEAEDLDEEDYSQKSYAYLMEVLEEAREYDYSYSVSKLEKMAKKIEDAIDELVKPKKSEKNTIAAKKELREFVNDDCEEIIKDEDKYTRRSFEDFYEVYDEALDMLTWDDAELDELEEMLEDLEYAIDDLELDD